jgi:DNA-binding NtrC family response regulator
LRPLTLQGRYLPDLAFHLNAVRFAIPALRERREDVIPIAQQMLHRICSRYQQHPHSLSNGAINRLLQHHWPGNLRELESVLEGALLNSASGLIRTSDLSFAEHERHQVQLTMPEDDLLLKTVVRKHVQYVLHLNRGNKLCAARQLGISRSTLYRVLGRKPLAIT